MYFGITYRNSKFNYTILQYKQKQGYSCARQTARVRGLVTTYYKLCNFYYIATRRYIFGDRCFFLKRCRIAFILEGSPVWDRRINFLLT